MRSSGWWLILVCMVAMTTGCTRMILSKGKSPLAPPRMSPDSVVLELFFVRFPHGDQRANVDLWQEVDEQHLPAETRKKLSANGFRVGLVSGPMPIPLSELLELKHKPVRRPDQVAQTESSSLMTEPRVVVRRVQCRKGQRVEVAASGILDELPILLSRSGEVTGETYTQAQAMFGLKTTPEFGGGVRIEMVPELHHGQAKTRWLGGGGALRQETSRARQAYDDFTMRAQLEAGQMLLVGCVDVRPGSLGHHFFSHEFQGHREQKLLVIRLAQTQHDDLSGLHL